jgi:hypothetical protein
VGGLRFMSIILAEPTDESDRRRHTGFARHKVPAGGPGSLSLSFAASGTNRVTTMLEQDTLTPNSPVNRWPSAVSLAVWALVGFATGFVVGGLGLVVSGAQGVGGSTVGVRVEVFGLIVRQGDGPESMNSVIWTWGVGILATFALVGAILFAVVRLILGGAVGLWRNGHSGEPSAPADRPRE